MSHRRTSPKVFQHSTELRYTQTDAERILWRYLRSNQQGVHFRCQHAIGPYIVDFLAISNRLIIELDGGQHLEQEAYDERRTAFLASRGFRVLRFWNHEVLKNLDAVMGEIAFALANGGEKGKD